MRRCSSIVGLFLFGLVGCSSSSGDDGATSANDITAGDAGTDASTACVPCADRFPEGKKTYDTARRSCFCADDICHEACTASLCAHTVQDPDSACGACIDASYSSCVQAVEAKCEANADCKQYVLCKTDAASACK